jgi:hypothetical protein
MSSSIANPAINPIHIGLPRIIANTFRPSSCFVKDNALSEQIQAERFRSGGAWMIWYSIEIRKNNTSRERKRHAFIFQTNIKSDGYGA